MWLWAHVRKNGPHRIGSAHHAFQRRVSHSTSGKRRNSNKTPTQQLRYTPMSTVPGKPLPDLQKVVLSCIAFKAGWARSWSRITSVFAFRFSKLLTRRVARATSSVVKHAWPYYTAEKNIGSSIMRSISQSATLWLKPELSFKAESKYYEPCLAKIFLRPKKGISGAILWQDHTWVSALLPSRRAARDQESATSGWGSSRTPYGIAPSLPKR